MNRRTVVQLLAGAVAVPVLSGYSAGELLALGRRLNARAAVGRGSHGLFDAHQRATVGAIAERIIPETDTPGAQAAGVPEFVELVVAEHYQDDERARFIAGLADVDVRCRAASGREFVDATPAAQDGILAALEADAERALANEKLAEKPREARQEKPVEKLVPFWGQIKFLTVYGYYTSEVGVKRELKSVVIPGRYDPCVAAGIRAPGGK